jgi:hypothetical protein
VRFGVVPNTAIINATAQTSPYHFFQGQTITLFVDRNQPTVLADELVRMTVFNPTTSTTVQITSTRGYNISGIGATASYSTGSCINGMNSCGNAASIANTVSYTIPSGWGLGSGLVFSISPGTQCNAQPCSGATPACTGAGCPGGGGGGTGLSSSGVLTATANATITVLASGLRAVDVFDPYTGKSVLGMGANASIATMGMNVSVSFTAVGGVSNTAPTTKLYFSNTGGGCGGSCTNLPGSALSFRTYGTYTYPTLTVSGANTGVHALKILIPANIMTTSTGGFGGVTPGTSATWAVSVTAGGVTNYSGFFSLFQPPSATPSISITPSAGSSPSSTPTPTPTPSLSRGAQPSVTATNSVSRSLTMTASPTPSPTISDSSRPSMSAQPDLAALARQQQAGLVGPIVGAVGGVLFLVCLGACGYVIQQRKARMEARMRMKASSRRFMGSQSNAYGNAHQDGAVHIGAANTRAERPETTVMFQVALPQGSSLPSSTPSGGKRPPRANSMNRR